MWRLLNKFSLDYWDLPTILWNIDVFWRKGTIKIYRKYASERISGIYYVIIFSSAGCYMYAYVLSMIWFWLFRLLETGDIKTAIVELSQLSLALASGTCIAKFLYMKLNANTVMNIIDDYLHCDKLVVTGTRFASNLLKKLRTLKKRAMSVWLVLVGNALVYFLIPVLMPGRHFNQDLCVLYGLEPMFESPNYEIAYFIMKAGGYFAVFILVHTTIFIIVFVLYLEALILTLSEELKHIWEDSQQFYNKYEHIYTNLRKDQVKNIFIKSRLKDIAKYHIITLNLRRKVDKELSVVFIMEFLFMILAVVTELMGGLENTYLQVSFTGGQAFIICLIGQKLIDASLIFEKTLYSCSWESIDVSNQKTILLMLQCSQRPMTLSAGGVAVHSLPYFMSIVKSTYSAYTTLNSSVNLSA